MWPKEAFARNSWLTGERAELRTQVPLASESVLFTLTGKVGGGQGEAGVVGGRGTASNAVEWACVLAAEAH